MLVDRSYYGNWTFPPLRFLYFNVAQSLAVFYGKNDWHYYLSQGYPLLLTTALPFSILGLVQAFYDWERTSTGSQFPIRTQLAAVCTLMPLLLSFISHKEVRFIYPLLPSLHVLTVAPLAAFFRPAISSNSSFQTPRRLLLIFLVLINVVVALYTTVFHMSGPLNVLDYLRQQYDRRHFDAYTSNAKSTSSSVPSYSLFEAAGSAITVGFLMPCHSTPWRSHLIFPGISAWALSCEPPVDLKTQERAKYLDEADQFYEDPATFLRKNMLGGLRNFPKKSHYRPHQPSTATTKASAQKNVNVPPVHHWPDYLVFFAQLEPTLQNLLRSSFYAECYRTWNTAWHDDWRRKGDVVVWCIDPIAQQEWREHNRLLHEATWKKATQNREKQFDRIIEVFKKEATDEPKSGKGGNNNNNNNNGGGAFFNFNLPSIFKSRSTSDLKPKSTSTSKSRSWSWSWPSGSGWPFNSFRKSAGANTNINGGDSKSTSWSWPWATKKANNYLPGWLPRLSGGSGDNQSTKKTSRSLRDLWS